MTATLYRCKAPGDYLCGCGRVARRLRRAGIDYEEERVAFSKADRQEIEAMTGQLYVPVLIIGDEVIHESHRIVEHIDWLTREGAA